MTPPAFKGHVKHGCQNMCLIWTWKCKNIAGRRHCLLLNIPRRQHATQSDLVFFNLSRASCIFGRIDIKWVEQTSIYIELGFQIWVDRISQQTKYRPRRRFRCEHLASVFSTQSECNGSRPDIRWSWQCGLGMAFCPTVRPVHSRRPEKLGSIFWQPSVSKAVLRKGLPRKWQDSGDGTIRVSGWRCEDSRLNQGYQSRLYLSRFTFYLKIHKCQDNRK